MVSREREREVRGDRVERQTRTTVVEGAAPQDRVLNREKIFIHVEDNGPISLSLSIGIGCIK